jgi:hypothetical protein
MKPEQDKKELYIKAKDKVRNIKVFYYHLVGYFIVVALLLYNIYILDETNPYANFFTWFNSIVMVAWTIFIAIHGWNVFKGRLWFKKDWEDKKIQEFMEEESDKTLWE